MKREDSDVQWKSSFVGRCACAVVVVAKVLSGCKSSFRCIAKRTNVFDDIYYFVTK